ncbi:hypothetical protein [Corynebacterium glutamicum]|uniref:Uncharacterized protein n=2 Tax=Corynebacterium glutamicum TaxID=1718 RepID=Q5KRK2_CORGT|nr:hypothetical protein [Corynebacterium glutamicum]BAD84079.1 hypothetical protein [Corynebacterium glutamicum]BAF54871.1 hypothetical protein cgR_1876 [Corynebacterium glutamicum R]
MSEPIIRTGDIPALSKAVARTCEAVGEVARQNKILAEAVSALSERIAVLEGRLS